MAGKVRVHELAKEIGVRSTDVLAVLRTQSKFVKSASSTLEAPVARRVREHSATASAGEPGPQSDLFGPTVANLVGELGVPQAAVVGYLRHLGVSVESGSNSVSTEFADEVRARFASTASRRDERSRAGALSSVAGGTVRPNEGKRKQATLGVDPAYFYVQEQASDVVHHLDYLSKRADHALCGCGGMQSRPSVSVDQKEVCRDCLARLPE